MMMLGTGELLDPVDAATLVTKIVGVDAETEAAESAIELTEIDGI